ncbi:unnamed protein product [Lactuca saligna]|uniref:Uncharacterized protein n=1 Tax=Lactuca saligna TaxID=75948 RepID=A0AA36EA93_LACSI|nr:unnamed protein product [Lactuca saligna]
MKGIQEGPSGQAQTPKKRKGQGAAPSVPKRQNVKKQQDSDDDAPVSQRHLKDLYQKLDSLIGSISSSSNITYFEAAVKVMLDTLVKEHAANLEKPNKAVENSTQSFKESTEKVDKLIIDAPAFMTDLRSAADSNVSNENKTSISYQITKLQEDLVVESKIMDELALKTTRVRVLSTKLTSANNEIVKLKSERAVMKRCMSDVNALLSNLIKAHDPMLPLTTCKDLAKKLCPIVAMLNRLEGV